VFTHGADALALFRDRPEIAPVDFQQRPPEARWTPTLAARAYTQRASGRSMRPVRVGVIGGYAHGRLQRLFLRAAGSAPAVFTLAALDTHPATVEALTLAADSLRLQWTGDDPGAGPSDRDAEALAGRINAAVAAHPVYTWRFAVHAPAGGAPPQTVDVTSQVRVQYTPQGRPRYLVHGNDYYRFSDAGTCTLHVHVHGPWFGRFTSDALLPTGPTAKYTAVTSSPRGIELHVRWWDLIALRHYDQQFTVDPQTLLPGATIASGWTAVFDWQPPGRAAPATPAVCA
jgi:hypothetical protein